MSLFAGSVSRLLSNWHFIFARIRSQTQNKTITKLKSNKKAHPQLLHKSGRERLAYMRHVPYEQNAKSTTPACETTLDDEIHTTIQRPEAQATKGQLFSRRWRKKQNNKGRPPNAVVCS